jgi:hypothetical protein
MNLAWVFLPAAVFWSSVTPVHGKLVVSGPLDRGPKCGYLTVDPRSRHSSFTKGACLRNRVRVVVDPHSQWWRVYVGRRLAFRYEDGSDTRPLSATGGGSLWLYDVWTKQGPQLLRYSLETGRLQHRLRFPVRLFRPLIAANDAGVWLMAATNGGTSGEAQSLYHVAPGSSRVQTVQRGARAAFWMTAHGRTLWLETVTGTHVFKLWRYDGTSGRLLSKRAPPYLFGTSYGDGALWGASARYCGKRVRALRIDALTGATATVANVPLLDCNQAGAGVYFRGSFWFVDGNELMRVR